MTPLAFTAIPPPSGSALGVCGLPSEVPAPVVRLTVAALIVLRAPELLAISQPYNVPFGANEMSAYGPPEPVGPITVTWPVAGLMVTRLSPEFGESGLV